MRFVMAAAISRFDPSLDAIAGLFHPPEQITSIDMLGSGNVNETFLVTLAANADRQAFVMQRLNTQVFEKPELVMRNLLALGTHVQQRLASAPPELAGRRWEIPKVLPTRDTEGHWVEHNGEFWRSISYIGAATTSDVISGVEHAREVGYGLGMFHHLISDLPITDLADTLEGFHITPVYLDHYDKVMSRDSGVISSRLCNDGRLKKAIEFVDKRRDGVDVLEAASDRGELKRRPIHGDPKINNVMLDEISGRAVGLIDLDTVKPGLVHYDIGDCLRSCCNSLGEETLEIDAVTFDLNLCRAILEGYLTMGRSFLSNEDFYYLPDSIRLIPFELGLRFLTDYLDGDRYFRTERPSHNLDRALVQFALTESIEAQWDDIQLMIRSLSGVG